VSAASQLQVGSARRVDVEGSAGSIAALRTGADGAPDVLLVPGYTGSKEDFGPVLDPLADAGYRVTAIDLPGQLDSPGPATVDGYTPAALARDLSSVIAALGAPVHLVGHSFGGLVARAAVIAQPGLAADLVLLCSGPSALGGLRRERIELLRPVLPQVGMAGLWQAMQAVFAAEPGYQAPPPDVAEFLERRFFAGSPEMLQGMGDALTSEPDRVAELARTGLRILVAHGADDDAWPPAVQKDMAARLGADYVVIPDSAHSPAVENPDATVAALLSFWRAG
jgi:pimeloyl-ACP methyl ester carboxylesterase